MESWPEQKGQRVTSFFSEDWPFFIHFSEFLLNKLSSQSNILILNELTGVPPKVQEPVDQGSVHRVEDGVKSDSPDRRSLLSEEANQVIAMVPQRLTQQAKILRCFQWFSPAEA